MAKCNQLTSLFFKGLTENQLRVDRAVSTLYTIGHFGGHLTANCLTGGNIRSSQPTTWLFTSKANLTATKLRHKNLNITYK